MSPWIQLSNTCTVKLLILALLLSAESFGQQHSTKSEITSYKAVVNLNLPRQEGRVPLYYSACCQKHAVEIQKAFEDMVSFYQEKLDIDTNVAVAVLDENDWDHVAQQMKDQGFAPYGMTNVSHAPSGVIAFIPADDEGVITKSQLADGRYASTATLKTFASAHLTYDEAARRFILHPAFHEVGHYLTHSYAMDLPDHWLDEMVASYWAYAYEKTRNPQIATIVEGFTEMSSPPFALASLDEFENAFAKKEGIPSANYVWYQRQFERRLIRVYNLQGISFLKNMKATFPVPPGGERQHTWLSVPDTLSRMESVCPGFAAWAKTLAERKTGTRSR